MVAPLKEQGPRDTKVVSDEDSSAEKYGTFLNTISFNLLHRNTYFSRLDIYFTLSVFSFTFFKLILHNNWQLKL